MFSLPMKRSWLAALLVLGMATTGLRSAGPAAGDATRLHAIFLADTASGDIGAPCKVDVEAFESFLRTVFAPNPERLQIHNLTGDAWTPDKVHAYLASLPVTSSENVLVYHSGHGAIEDRTKPEESQILALNRGHVRRADIRNLLAARQPRGLIILTDCCSSYRGVGSVQGRALVGLQAPNTVTVRNLLLRASGVISITAAEDGTSAIAAHLGPTLSGAQSAFTVALLNLWSDPAHAYNNWAEFFPILRETTAKVSGGVHQARAFVIREVTVAASGQVAPQVVPQGGYTPRIDANYQRP